MHIFSRQNGTQICTNKLFSPTTGLMEHSMLYKLAEGYGLTVLLKTYRKAAAPVTISSILVQSSNHAKERVTSWLQLYQKKMTRNVWQPISNYQEQKSKASVLVQVKLGWKPSSLHSWHKLQTNLCKPLQEIVRSAPCHIWFSSSGCRFKLSHNKQSHLHKVTLFVCECFVSITQIEFPFRLMG